MPKSVAMVSAALVAGPGSAKYNTVAAAWSAVAVS